MTPGQSTTRKLPHLRRLTSTRGSKAHVLKKPRFSVVRRPEGNRSGPVGDWVVIDRLVRGQHDFTGNIVAYYPTRSTAKEAAEKRNTHPSFDLIGTAEAADILQVERPRIGRWKKNRLLPEPMLELASGPIWQRQDIEAVLEERERRRRPGSVSVGSVISPEGAGMSQQEQEGQDVNPQDPSTGEIGEEVGGGISTGDVEGDVNITPETAEDKDA